MLQRACSCLQVKIKWCKCHGIWSWWKSWREVEEYLKRWSNLGWGSKHNGRFTSTYQNVHQSLSVGSTVTSINYYFLQMTVTLFFADWEDAYVYWCSCQFYELFYFFFFNCVQTESEMEVKGLLDDLGIREKQQFVRVPASFQIYEWIYSICLFLVVKRDFILKLSLC